jgi:UDP-N-acetylmuramate dehydrogenase
VVSIETYLKTNTQSNDLIHIKTIGQLLENRDNILEAPQKLIIGDTSNILFKKDFAGLILKNSILGKPEVERTQGDKVYLRVPAGMNWHKLVEYTVKHNLWGIENLALIPGLVGSAPIQNIGAYGTELSDCAPVVCGINLATMKNQIFTPEECQFRYRESIFKQQLQDKLFIHSVIIRLHTTYQAKLEYKELNNTFKNSKPTQQEIMQTVCRIRQDRLPNPQEEPNLGSFFKNPILDKKTYLTLQKNNPPLNEIPSYEVTNNPQKIKLSAAALIDNCGLKGYQHPNKTAVSKKHALVLTNPQHKSGKDVLELAQYVQTKVQQKYSINLEPEVRIV